MKTLTRTQDVTDLVGHVIFNRGARSIQVIAGNSRVTGNVLFKQDKLGTYWVGMSGLREDINYTDITGMSARAARKAVGDYSFKPSEKWFKLMIEAAIK